MSDPSVKAAMEAVDIHEWFRSLPWRRGRSPLSLAPDYEVGSWVWGVGRGARGRRGRRPHLRDDCALPAHLLVRTLTRAAAHLRATALPPRHAQRYIFEDWQSDTVSDKWRRCGLYAKGYLEQFADVPVMIICSW